MFPLLFFYGGQRSTSYRRQIHKILPKSRAFTFECERASALSKFLNYPCFCSCSRKSPLRLQTSIFYIFVKLLTICSIIGELKYTLSLEEKVMTLQNRRRDSHICQLKRGDGRVLFENGIGKVLKFFRGPGMLL